MVKRLTPEQMERHKDLFVLTPEEMERQKDLFFPRDTDELRLAGQSDYFWKPKSTLNVFFIDREVYKGMYNDILKLAGRWSLYGSIKFKQVYGWADADISISFERGSGWNSGVGRQSKAFAMDKQPSMNLDPAEGMNKGFMTGQTKRDKYCRGAVRHEFGHALGFIHEHQRPDRPFTWDVEWLKGNYQQLGFSSFESVQANIIDTKPGPFNKSAFDYNSVMIYQWPAQATKEGVSSDNRDFLSALDRSQMGKIYPK